MLRVRRLWMLRVLVAPALLLCKGSEVLSLDVDRLMRYGVLLHRDMKGRGKARHKLGLLASISRVEPEKNVRCGRRTCTKERCTTSAEEGSVLTEHCKILMYNRHKPRTNTTQPILGNKSRPPHFAGTKSHIYLVA